MWVAFVTLLRVAAFVDGNQADLQIAPATMRHPTLDAIIVCDEPDHDFGRVWIGSEITHAFRIRNEGSERAWLRLDHASLGGAASYFEIEPRGTICVPMPVETAHRYGRFLRTATLTFVERLDDLRCSQCGKWMGSEDHLQQCGAVCTDPDFDSCRCKPSGESSPR